MLFNVVNPSDPYTMDAPDLMSAAVAVCLIGEGKYGLTQIDAVDGEQPKIVPVFLLTSHEDWFTEHFGQGFADTLTVATSAEHMPNLIKALDSLVYGHQEDRAEFLRQLQAQPPAEREDFRLRWQAERRTSTAQIAEHAWGMAAYFRKQLANGQVDKLQ